jgi:hypothetical protein
MMISSYYHIYQVERGKTAAEIRAADAQLGHLAAKLGGQAAKLGQLGSALAAPLHAVRRSLRRQQPPACPVAPDAG